MSVPDQAPSQTTNFLVLWLPPYLQSTRDSRRESARTSEEARCLRLTSHWCAPVSARRGEPITGGCSRWLCSSVCRHSSFIPRGPRCRDSTSGLGHISHRFIRRCCSVPRVGSAQTQAGYPPG